MFQALLDPVVGNLGLSALVACIPLLAFFIMLLGVKAKAHVSAVVALAVALLVGIIGFQMPADLAFVSATQGAAFGAFPIVYIICMAVWFYEVTVVSGRSEDLRKFFDQVGGGDKEDHRMKKQDSEGGCCQIAQAEAQGADRDAECDSVPDREGVIGRQTVIPQSDTVFSADFFHWKCLLKM